MSKGENPIFRPALARTPNADGHEKEAATGQWRHKWRTHDEGRRPGREEAHSTCEMQRTGAGRRPRREEASSGDARGVAASSIYIKLLMTILPFLMNGGIFSILHTTTWYYCAP